MNTVKERILISGCEGKKNGYNTQLLYFTCSSLSMDDRYLFLITDKNRDANVMVRDLVTGSERKIFFNSRSGRYVKVYAAEI